MIKQQLEVLERVIIGNNSIIELSWCGKRKEWTQGTTRSSKWTTGTIYDVILSIYSY